MLLPEAEAVPFLKQCWLAGTIGHSANYLQALAFTKSPDALDFLRDCFPQIWNTDGLLADDGFCNWIAHDAIWCIKHLIDLGENAAELRSAYATLKTHSCARTREQAQRWLSEYFEVGPSRNQSEGGAFP